MAHTKQRRNIIYGYTSPQVGLQQEPIVEKFSPDTNENAELGTIWVDTSVPTYYVLTNTQGNTNTWTPPATGGATTLTSLTVDPGNLTVTTGNVAITAGSITAGGAATFNSVTAGNGTFTGNVAITGSETVGGLLTANGGLTIVGAFNLNTAGAIHLTSTDNVANAIELVTNGGTSETLSISSTQGTSAHAVGITATAGGVSVTSGTSTTILDTGGAGVDTNITNTNGSINITAGEAAVDAIVLDASNAAGGIEVTSGTGGLAMTSTGAMTVASTGNYTLNVGSGSTLALSNSNTTTITNLSTGGSTVNKVVTIGSQSLGSPMTLRAGTGGITNAIANGPFVVTTGTGEIDISSDSTDTTINLGIGAGAKQTTIGSINAGSSTTIQSADGGILLSAPTGDITIASTVNDAGAISIFANGSTAAQIAITNEHGTASTAIALNAPAGGITLNSPQGLLLTAAQTTTNAAITISDNTTPTALTASILAYNTSPDTVVTASVGSLCIETDVAHLWINTDGATAWTMII